MKLTLMTGHRYPVKSTRPQPAQHALGPHRTLGCSRAARRVEDHRQPPVVVAVERRRRGHPAAAVDQLAEQFDVNPLARQPNSCLLQCFSVVIDVGVVVEHHHAAHRRVAQRRLDRQIQVVGAGGDAPAAGSRRRWAAVAIPSSCAAAEPTPVPGRRTPGPRSGSRHWRSRWSPRSRRAHRWSSPLQAAAIAFTSDHSSP